MTTLNNTVKATRQTQLPLVPMNEGGISQTKPTLSAKWTTENGQLVCQWGQH